jgi:ribose transport system substrate-binding protein
LADRAGGARKAGQDLGVKIVELGAKSESHVNGQIGILETAVASNPAAIVIAPAQFAALGRPIDEAANMTSLIATDNVKAGRVAAEALAGAITKTYGDTEGNVVIITSMPGVASLDQRAKGFREALAAKYRALDILPTRSPTASQ